MKKILGFILAAAAGLILPAAALAAGPEAPAYPPLSPSKNGRPVAAVHYLASEEEGKIKLAAQVLAPGATLEAVRIDNITGRAAVWRSDGEGGEAGPLTVAREGETLADGHGKMAFGPLGEAEELLTLTLADNDGAFKDRQAEFRVTVFMAGGARALCLLKAADQPASALAQASEAAPAAQAQPAPQAVTVVEVVEPPIIVEKAPAAQAQPAPQAVTVVEVVEPPIIVEKAPAAQAQPAPGASSGQDTPYGAFSLVMDRLSGPGQWSARSHDESFWSGLTVKGLTFPASSSLISRTEKAGPGGQATVDTVQIKKLLPRNQLAKLLDMTDWQGQPETDLVSGLSLQGFHWREARPEGAEIKIEELNLEGLKLAKAAPDAPAGEAGFWKALRLASLGHKNFRLSVKEPKAETSVNSTAFEGLSFDSYLPEKSGSGVRPSPWGALNAAKSIKAEGLALEFQSRGGPEDPDKINLSLAGLSVSGLDMVDYLVRPLAGLASARDRQEATEAILNGQSTLANFFVSPISLEEAALTGLKIDLAGRALVKADEIKTVGPYRAGEIPAKAKSWTKGLEISLKGDPQAKPGSPGREIYEFCQVLGQTAFAVEAETDSSYETGTGRWTTRLGRFSVSNLFELSGSQTWSGLTRDRLEKFKKIPLAEHDQAAKNPEDILGETSINALNLKYTDRGLGDAVFRFQAKAAGGAAAAEQLKEQTLAQAGMMLALFAAPFIKNNEDLSRPLLGFLKTPQSLEINVKPEQTLVGLKKALDSEPAVMLDFLNITVSANGQAGSPLRFVPGLMK